MVRKSNYEKHGLTGHPDYRLWMGIVQRCTNPNNSAYHNYGGRGITICDAWAESFKTFIQDMGNRPNPSYSIERIDVNGNYEPSNCKWATKTEQCRNMRAANKNISGIRGVSYDKSTKSWAVYITIDRVKKHLGRYKDIEVARAIRKDAEAKYWGLIAS